MNKAAQALGRLSKGKPRKFSPEQLAAASQRLALARAARSHAKPKSTTQPLT